MTGVSNRFCSWCYQATEHELSLQNVVRRNVYKCRGCEGHTLQCMVISCTHMARTGKRWDDNLCAEHDGSVAAFSSLGRQLEDIKHFKEIFERDSTNLLRVAKIAGGTAAGAVILTPLALVAAPGLAGALGSAGFLGAAGTGTAISTLSGAALTNASLAAIGGGAMAGGVAVVTAAGAALGAYQGGVVSNSYFGQVDHFDIRKLREGSKHAVVVVNGFLSQGSDTADWTEHLQKHFPKASWYHTDWESKTLHKLGLLAATSPKAAGLAMAKDILGKMPGKAARRASPITWATQVFDLVGNPWHVSMVKAQLTGVMLADAIARTPGWKFTLAGHSLGARVIHYTLEALATKEERFIENVYLLGGAVGGDARADKDWEKAVRAVRGRIFNCYSSEDAVLKYLYQGANGGLSTPIGLKAISLENEKIFNFDCTALVDSHMQWKVQFGEVLAQLREY